MNKEQINKCIEVLKNELNNNSIYLWGGSGELVRSLSVFDIFIKEDTRANAGRVLRHIADLLSTGKDIDRARAFDCSGLIIEALQSAGVIPHNYDTTAQGLYSMCTLYKEPKDAKKGDLVFIRNSSGKIVHVGMVTTKQYVIEAKGRDYGVVARKLSEGAWTDCGTF